MVRGGLHRASRTWRSSRAARSGLPLAHQQQARDGDQLGPTELGHAVAAGLGGADCWGHDGRWEL